MEYFELSNDQIDLIQDRRRKYETSMSEFATKNDDAKRRFTSKTEVFPDEQYDRRPSKSILEEIIKKHGISGEEKQNILMSVNGVVGAANNKRNGYDKGTFLEILKQRFDCKFYLSEIVEDEDFGRFLINRTVELYNK